MDFLNLNRFNAFMNIVSGNMLPVTSEETKLSTIEKIYKPFVWLVQLTFMTVVILGIRNVPAEKSLKDSTVTIAVTLEGIILSVYMNSRRNLLRRLIEKLNSTLNKGNVMLETITIESVKPLEKMLQLYTISSIVSVLVWAFLQFIKITETDQFYYVDYRVAAVFSREPFSVKVFVAGGLVVSLGNVYAITRKASLDLYMIHMIRLITAQYKYLRRRFAEILRCNGGTSLERDDVWGSGPKVDEPKVKQRMRLLAFHYESIIQMATILKDILAPNIGVLYINSVFRFCFLSIMFVMISTENIEKYLVLMYTLGALVQLYMVCFSIQELFEASKAIADDALYEKWWVYDSTLQHATVIMIFGNKLECKVSSIRSIDLTLPSFMSILNQAYSVCLLFLKVG